MFSTRINNLQYPWKEGNPSYKTNYTEQKEGGHREAKWKDGDETFTDVGFETTTHTVTTSFNFVYLSFLATLNRKKKSILNYLLNKQIRKINKKKGKNKTIFFSKHPPPPGILELFASKITVHWELKIH